MAGDEAGRGRLASGFELQQDEVFDERGFLARRGEIIALEASARGLDAARKLGFRVIERGRLQVLGTSVVRLQTPANLSTLEALRLIRNSDPAGRYDHNHLYDGSAAPQLAQAPTNSRSRAPSQRRGTRPPQRAPAVAGPSVRLGIIDTSVDARHPEFQGRRLTTQNFGDRAQANAVSEHGTAVASLLIGRTLGALPDAELLAANVFYSTPRGDHLAEAEDLVQAIDWMMVKRVPVVNMSLTGPPNVVVEEAIRRAIARGHVIVAAVGNAGPAAPALFPASYPGVIGVTAVDSERRVYRRANRGDCVDFSAFGVDVEAAAAGGLAKFTGTSFAAPLVAAAVAAKQNTLSAAKENAATSAVEQLRSGVVDLGAPGRDNTYGHGLVEGGVAKRVAGR
jgi:subtilisin family serine protease